MIGVWIRTATQLMCSHPTCGVTAIPLFRRHDASGLGVCPYSRGAESLTPHNYRNASSVALEQVSRVELSERTNANARRGSVQLQAGTVLENVHVYVAECSWWEQPGIQGTLTDAAVTAIVFDPL